MVYGIINIFEKYLMEDLPLIITSFICMFFIFQIYLPKTKAIRKWLSIFIIEGVEHVVLPFVLLIELIFTDSWITAALFHLTLLIFLFGFMGYYVIKARDKETWFRVFAIAGYAYFFIFLYPFVVVSVQLYSPDWFSFFNGWYIMGITILLFFGMYLLRNKEKEGKK